MTASPRIAEVADLLDSEGPMTGAELVARTRADPLELWRVCRGTDQIVVRTVGRRYLRLDRAVAGYARLSPSIRREFLTYAVIGTPSQAAQLAARGELLLTQAAQISRMKTATAREAMASVFSDLAMPPPLAEQVTVLIAGDVCYDMAHTVPRPESSTDSMVRGSDLDVIVVAADDFPQDLLNALDQAIYRKKHYMLTQPTYREEIDYIVKRLDKVRVQLGCDTFEHCVAAKILEEGQYLGGSRAVFDEVKALVSQFQVPERVASWQAQAVRDREVAERHLLASSDDIRTGEHFNLFYTREEGDEIY